MKKLVWFAFITISALSLAGCPKKPTIVKEEARAPETKPEPPKEAAKPEPMPEVKPEPKPETKPEAIKPVEESKPIELTEAQKLARLKEEFRFEDIHFDYDRYDISEKDRETLKNLSDWLLKNGAVKIKIEAHADERGTNEYNLALGDRRANTVKQYLATLGVGAERIGTISYGEETPLCAESTEECWWKNRRAHFIFGE